MHCSVVGSVRSMLSRLTGRHQIARLQTAECLAIGIEQMEGMAARRECNALADLDVAIAVAAYHDVLSAGERHVDEVGFAQMLHQIDSAVEMFRSGRAAKAILKDVFGAQAQRDLVAGLGRTRCNV